MQKKIVGIFICTLLILTAVLPLAESMKINSKKIDAADEIFCYEDKDNGINSKFAELLEFGDIQDVNSLEILRETKEFSKGAFIKTVSIEIDIRNIKISKTDQNFDLLKIEDLKSTGKTGEPTSYIKSIKVDLEKNAKVTGIKLVDGEYVEIHNKINLAPRKKPAIWCVGVNNDNRLIKDEEIYSRDEFFPYRTVSFVSGQDNKNTVLYLQFYPVQYNPVQQKAILIKNATFEVHYVIENVEETRSSNMKSDAENIIITTSAFLIHAEDLKNLHETLEGTPSEVITTEWMSSNYTAAPEPITPGYATISQNPVKNNYDYELAKKIVSFLRDTSAHPNLKSITIFGDAEIIPPSYYFYCDWEFVNPEYNNWIVSDLFYSSPDYDMVLNYEVGRLPVANTKEAALIVQKIENWKTNLDESWFYNVQLVGGAPFGIKYLSGEVNTVYPVNEGYLAGMNIGKNFLTNNKLTKSVVLPYFSDENTGIIFHFDHGNGNVISIMKEKINYDDLLSLAPAEKYPVLISIACMNGGYDAELMNNCHFTDCIGEGVLRSLAGGIAYWGGVRTNTGGVDVWCSETGEIITSDPLYMGELLFNLFKAYSEGILRMGELTKQAFEWYMQEFNVEDIAEYSTAYEFVFLGDPVLSWRFKPTSTEYDNVVYDLDPKPDKPGSWFFEPVYNLKKTSSVSIAVETNSPSVNFSIHSITIHPLRGEIIVNELVNLRDTTPFEYEYELNDVKTFLVISETDDFKETRLYFRTKRGLIRSRDSTEFREFLDLIQDNVIFKDFFKGHHPHMFPILRPLQRFLQL